MTGQAFALFDFDGTLASGDSIVPYLLFCIRHGIAPKHQVFLALLGWLRQLVKPELAGRAKEMTLSFIKGHDKQEMDALARAFFREVILPKHLYRESMSELLRLKDEGKRIVIVSASAEVYMRVIGEFLPVDDVLATPCPIDSTGRYTGEIGANCRGEEKVRRINAYLADKGLLIDRESSRAYGDTAGDAPMLRLTAHPVLVCPRKKLVKLLPDAPVCCWRHEETSTSHK